MKIKARQNKRKFITLWGVHQTEQILGAGSPKFKSEMGKELPVVLDK